MISLTTTTGASVSINPILVFGVVNGGDATIVISAAGKEIAVREPYDEVVKLVKRWAKG